MGKAGYTETELRDALEKMSADGQVECYGHFAEGDPNCNACDLQPICSKDTKLVEKPIQSSKTNTKGEKKMTNYKKMTDDQIIELAEENEVEVVYTGKGKSKKLDREATIELIEEAEVDAAGDDEEGEEEVYSQEDLDEMADEDLEEIADDMEIAVPYKGKGKSKKLDRDSLITLILEAQDEEEEEDSEEEEEGEELTLEELNELSDDELVELAEENEVDVPYKGKGKSKKVDRDALIAELAEALELEEEDSDEEEEEDETEGYTQEDLEEMSDEELIELAEENEIEVTYKGKGKSKKLDREALIEELASEEDSEEEEDGEEDSEEELITMEDLEEMSDEELVETAEENEVEAVYTGKGKKKKLDREGTIEAIAEALELEESEEESDEEEGYSQEDLEEMSDDELIELAEENEIEVTYKGKGSKKKLDRAALIEELASDSDEEEEDEEDEDEEEEAPKSKTKASKKPAAKKSDMTIEDVCIAVLKVGGTVVELAELGEELLEEHGLECADIKARIRRSTTYAEQNAPGFKLIKDESGGRGKLHYHLVEEGKQKTKATSKVVKGKKK